MAELLVFVGVFLIAFGLGGLLRDWQWRGGWGGLPWLCSKCR